MMAGRLYKWFIFALIWFLPICFLAQNAKPNPKQDSLANTPEGLYKTASTLSDSAKYEQALALLKKALKAKPNYWEAINKTAYIKLQLKEYKEVLKELDKAEKIAPMNFESLKMRAITFYKMDKFKEAKVAIDTAMYVLVEDKLDDAEIFYYRALLMFKGKAYKTALETCESALDLKPNYIDVIELKGEIRFAKKEYNYAIKELNDAIKLMTDANRNYYAYKLRAKSKFEVGDYKGAITDWDAYIDGMPEEEEALISRGAAKINVNNNSGAISDMDQAIKINPKNPVSYCYRGVAKGGNKQYVEALKDLDYAIKLKFDYPAAYVNRAAIKMASKDKRGACEDLGKADGLGDEMAVKLYDQYCKDMQR